MIRESGIIDLPEIFRLVPGFYVGSNASFLQTANPVVSYHGMTDAYSRRMQVLIDGRSVYEPMYGGVQWSDLPIAIADIERIEVTRGPNAASYGANSFLGAINIITQHASQARGSSVSMARGNGRSDTFYRYGGKLDDLDYRITIGHRVDEGIQARYDAKRTNLFTARADYRASDNDVLEFQFGYNGGSREEGDRNFDALVFREREKDAYSHFQQVRWRHTMNQTSDFSLQAYHSVSESDDPVTSINLQPLFNPIPLQNPRLFIDNDVKSERFEVEAQHTFSPISSVRTVWGGSLRTDRTTAPFYLNSDKTDDFHLQRLFGHAEWRPLDRVTLNAGAMLEHNDFTGSDVSPRFSANVRLAPGHTLRVGVSAATRTPTYLEEKFMARFVVPTQVPGLTFIQERLRNLGGLKPERILSKEIGYLGTFGTLSLDTRIFDDAMRDFMQSMKFPDPYTVPPGFTRIPGTPRPFTYTNSGDAAVRGFELQAQWRLWESTRLIANYARVKIYGHEDELERDFLDSAPNNTISALLTHRFNSDWDASLAYYQTSRVSALGDGDPVQLARHADLRIARKFELGSVRGELSGVAQNAFNSHYEEFAAYNVMRRRAFVNLRLDF
jgi:iron complex outermembrane receptor protein